MTTPPALPPELNPRRPATGAGDGAVGGGAGGTLYGVAPAGPTGGNGGRRALTWLVCAVSLMVLLGSGGAWGYVQYVGTRFHSIALCTGRGCFHPAEKKGQENFLLVGSDTRAGDNSTGDLTGLKNGTAGNGLSDSVMLVHLSESNDRVTVLSFPRDMLVTRPAYTTSTGRVVPAAPAKFNAAFSIGGPQLLIKQVEQVSNLRVDHYIQIDFHGFIGVIDALGGVDICIAAVPGWHNWIDPGGDGSGGSGFKGHPGINHLTGLTALEYVRQRHGLPEGDLDRIKRQHELLSTVFRGVESAGTLLNPVKLTGIIDSLASDMTLGQTSTSDLIRLGENFHSLDGNKIGFYTVPTTGAMDGALGSVQIANAAQAQEIYAAIAADQDPAHPVTKPSTAASGAPTAQPALTVPASQIALSVENGSGITGQGVRAARDLRAAGFRVLGVANAAEVGQSQTIVRYGSDRSESARTVAAAIPGATAQADTSLGPDDVVVVTGSGYTGAHTVTVGKAPAAAPTHAAPTTAAASPSAAAAAVPESPTCGA